MVTFNHRSYHTRRSHRAHPSLRFPPSSLENSALYKKLGKKNENIKVKVVNVSSKCNKKSYQKKNPHSALNLVNPLPFVDSFSSFSSLEEEVKDEGYFNCFVFQPHKNPTYSFSSVCS